MSKPGDVCSTWRRGSAYRYIRATDRLPSIASVLELPHHQLVAKVKLFDPQGHATWWICAYDVDTGNAYGLVDLHEKEVGLFHMPELVALRGRFGLPIERDLHFHALPVSEVLGVSA